MGWLQKPGPPRRGSAALKHPGTCSPHPARPQPPLKPHIILAKGPCSVCGPGQATAGRGRPWTGGRGRTGSVGRGEPYGSGASQAAPAPGQMAAGDGGWRRMRAILLTIILEAASVARCSSPQLCVGAAQQSHNALRQTNPQKVRPALNR